MFLTIPDFARFFFMVLELKRAPFSKYKNDCVQISPKALWLTSQIISPNHMPFSFYLKGRQSR